MAKAVARRARRAKTKRAGGAKTRRAGVRKEHGKPAKRRAVAARSAPPGPADGHKRSHVTPDLDVQQDAAFQPKPVHFRLLEAYELAFQDGANPTDAVIAKRLNVRRETITRWRRRNPELRRWLYEHIGRRAEELRPLVDRRVTQLAISGSVDHAKLFYQFVAKVGDPERDPAVRTPPAFTMNFLIPRPDTSHLGTQCAPAALPAAGHPSVPPLSDIPFIKVR